MLHGARFTPKGSFSSIYLASDPITALMEIVSVFDHPNWARSSPPACSSLDAVYGRRSSRESD